MHGFGGGFGHGGFGGGLRPRRFRSWWVWWRLWRVSVAATAGYGRGYGRGYGGFGRGFGYGGFGGFGLGLGLRWFRLRWTRIRWIRRVWPGSGIWRLRWNSGAGTVAMDLATAGLGAATADFGGGYGGYGLGYGGFGYAWAMGSGSGYGIGFGGYALWLWRRRFYRWIRLLLRLLDEIFSKARSSRGGSADAVDGRPPRYSYLLAWGFSSTRAQQPAERSGGGGARGKFRASSRPAGRRTRSARTAWT